MLFLLITPVFASSSFYCTDERQILMFYLSLYRGSIHLAMRSIQHLSYYLSNECNLLAIKRDFDDFLRENMDDDIFDDQFYRPVYRLAAGKVIFHKKRSYRKKLRQRYRTDSMIHLLEFPRFIRSCFDSIRDLPMYRNIDSSVEGGKRSEKWMKKSIRFILKKLSKRVLVFFRDRNELDPGVVGIINIILLGENPVKNLEVFHQHGFASVVCTDRSSRESRAYKSMKNFTEDVLSYLVPVVFEKDLTKLKQSLGCEEIEMDRIYPDFNLLVET
jgi:hypothetical protein